MVTLSGWRRMPLSIISKYFSSVVIRLDTAQILPPRQRPVKVFFSPKLIATGWWS